MNFSKRKKFKKVFDYSCTITGDTFKTHKEAPHPEELMTVSAYYDLNPDEDDRPEIEKIKIKQRDQNRQELKEQLLEQMNNPQEDNRNNKKKK
jgi:hypothetical protein